MKPNGFTLIEILVAMVILAFLAVFTSQSIQRALKDKVKIQAQTDQNATLRDALKVMERDINEAFNYRDVAIELYNKTQQERKKKAGQSKKQKDPKDPNDTNQQDQQQLQQTVQDPNKPDPYAPKEDPQKGFTQFWGEKEKLNFSSLSNIRMSEDAQMDTQAEIGYFLKNCRRRSTQEQASNCLWRRVSNYIDEDIDKGGEETVLLENVESMTFKYLGPGKDDEWIDTWISGQRGDDLTKGKFPYAVEITITVKNPGNQKEKSLTMTSVAAIRNPNNPPDTSTEENNQKGIDNGSKK